MSEADRLFEELGYEEIETSGDNLLEYKKQFPGYSKFIRFDLLDRTFTSFYYISNTQSYLNMQELQAINKKSGGITDGYRRIKGIIKIMD